VRQVEPPFEERAFLARSFNEILTHPAAPSIIAVDIPIGFPERITNAGRERDCAAREVLGKRASSVFAPPARAVLSETDYRRACAAALATSNPPRKISKQMKHPLFPPLASQKKPRSGNGLGRNPPNTVLHSMCRIIPFDISVLPFVPSCSV
jgi:hypothetical protein